MAALDNTTASGSTGEEPEKVHGKFSIPNSVLRSQTTHSFFYS